MSFHPNSHGTRHYWVANPTPPSPISKAASARPDLSTFPPAVSVDDIAMVHFYSNCLHISFCSWRSTFGPSSRPFPLAGRRLRQATVARFQVWPDAFIRRKPKCKHGRSIVFVTFVKERMMPKNREFCIDNGSKRMSQSTLCPKPAHKNRHTHTHARRRQPRALINLATTR